MTFSEFVEKYKNIADNFDDCTMIIKSFMFSERGDIQLSKYGFTVEGDYLSIYTKIAEKRTPEQMDLFLQAIL